MRTRTASAALAAALLAATSGTHPAHAALAPGDRRILAPSIGLARACVRDLGALSDAVQVTVRHLNEGLPGSAYLTDDAASAILTCHAGQRWGVQRLVQRYPLRARTGHLRVVLARLSRLFGGGTQAGQSSLQLAAGIDNGTIDQVAANNARDALDELTQAGQAIDALRPDVGDLYSQD